MTFLSCAEEATDTHLDAEVASVYVVPEEQVTGGAGGPTHLEELHQVEELTVDISAHCTYKDNKLSITTAAFRHRLS